ncbi:hypothetical protein P879_01945 [Paragonimus westermani]|uniref:Uncharacterized protein n=1 Tax=Paragonimus westermani TaxID=34504 RepID=A0A8T0DR58_9TREM|nr:hypothetical protein P879_01945 [Paragonimus westermani]
MLVKRSLRTTCGLIDLVSASIVSENLGRQSSRLRVAGCTQYAVAPEFDSMHAAVKLPDPTEIRVPNTAKGTSVADSSLHCLTYDTHIRFALIAAPTEQSFHHIGINESGNCSITSMSNAGRKAWCIDGFRE